MNLYQKYRPKDFDDLVGQQFISKALGSALLKGKTVSTYLFCGSRGTGKTSVARILAKACNCTNLSENGNPCGACANCLAFADGTMMDIVEIDGASNNGVANVRELIERARFQPNTGKYKIYIIDEVHMLSQGAFNALLKTLEEPPDHVKFILATTEFHKIPETIVSRSQRYDFRKISDEDIIGRLKYVAKEEEITADKEALELIAQLSRGGLRDALSLLEQYSVGGILSYDFIRDNLRIVGKETLDKLTDILVQNGAKELISFLDELRLQSIEPKRFLEQYLYYIRDRAFLEIESPHVSRLVAIFDACTRAYSRIKEFPNGFLLLELMFLGLVTPGEVISSTKTSVWVKKEIHTEVPKEIPQKEIETPLATPKKAEPEISSPPVASEKQTTTTKNFSFVELIELVKKTPKKGVLLSALKSGTFEIDEAWSVFTLFVGSEFVRSQLDTPENKDFMGTSLQSLFGLQAEIRFALASPKFAWNNTKPPLNAAEVSDIF